MTKLTLRLAVAAALVASAPGASALSISDLFSSSSASASQSGGGFLSFKPHTKRLDAEDTTRIPALSAAASSPASSETSTGGTLSSVLPVVSPQAAISAEGISVSPPNAVTDLVSALAVPVTSVAAVVSSQKVEDTAADGAIASTPLPAGGLLLGFAALALAAQRRLRRKPA